MLTYKLVLVGMYRSRIFNILENIFASFVKEKISFYCYFNLKFIKGSQRPLGKLKLKGE